MMQLAAIPLRFIVAGKFDRLSERLTSSVKTSPLPHVEAVERRFIDKACNYLFHPVTVSL